MIRTVLVPLDGSAWAEEALPHAMALARAFEADVVLFRVLDSSAVASGRIDSVSWRLERQEVEAYLEERAKPLREAGHEVRVEVGEGEPAQEIVALTRRQKADLVVLGSHGRGEATPFRLGSTTQKVLSAVESSVLLVRTSEEARSRPSDGYERILVPLDCSARAEWALCLAASLARDVGGEILMVHVVAVPRTAERLVPTPEEQRLVGELTEQRRKSAEAYLARMRQVLTDSKVTAYSRIEVSSEVVQTLERIIQEEGADLMVLSAHGCSGAAPWPHGSVASRVLAHGTTPVLVLQDLCVDPDALRVGLGEKMDRCAPSQTSP